jgi:hypothetical protein
VATNPSPDVVLAPLVGQPRTVREWVTTFHLAFVALDPFTYQSAWILETAGRILTNFEQADVRVAFLVTCDAEEARAFLGPWSREVLTFLDPERTAVKGFGLEGLPAFVHLGMDLEIVNAAEGWHPLEWRKATDELARITSWLAPVVPGPKDPGPFEPTSALG